MAEVLRFSLESTTRIPRKHLSGQQTEISAVLRYAKRGILLRQGIREKQGNGYQDLHPHPFAGQLFGVAHRKSRGQFGLPTGYRWLYRPSMDWHCPGAGVLQWKGKGKGL